MSEQQHIPQWILLGVVLWVMFTWLISTSIFGYNASDVTQTCTHRGGVRQLVDETFLGGGGKAIVICADGSARHLGSSPVP